MEAVARASIAAGSHARVPLCRRPRPRHAVRCLRGRPSVACAAAADADVVRLFDAAKLTVIRETLCRPPAFTAASFEC
ncbi:unnamed protein product [Triticum turgidum subsp. durum]|uniref:Uncharacterized protein n=1 Tax=Triticum turgidum subsp. durum TaxID=4567 RepID=A0A9R0TZ46_TRITD|nr:unnamed protein product [Triticum turgidum subsp. durum]